MTREHFDPEWKKELEQKHDGLPEVKAAMEARKGIKKSFEVVARTTDGKIIFNALMKELGFKGTTIPGTSITNMNDVIANETRRRVWIQIRALIPVDLRNAIEQDEEV